MEGGERGVSGCPSFLRGLRTPFTLIRILEIITTRSLPPCGSSYTTGTEPRISKIPEKLIAFVCRASDELTAV
ncbi:hypothetical protein F7725_028712 [Dissostichus mawsoni]|uniref:Uncharacterized protein n=1 Tax=Dissostichus mawsoni TaxID=36200 RepID=A0A7J5XGJ5_DISMA|nr:hypothetical protein F7725_028712 [Dissostichus mawsoni]